MHLTEDLAPYLSASPQSLALLIKTQEEENASYPGMSDEESATLSGINRKPDEDWLGKQN